MTSTEQIKHRLDIVSVVGSYIKLTKAGKNMKALCPFHNERTPSFVVSPDRNTYHCFGCGKGGDIFSFTQDIEGVDFKEALHSLADRAGVDIGAYNPKEKSEQETLRGILLRAAAHYSEALAKNSLARDYLLKRGVSEDSISGFSLGYVPDEWEWVGDHLRKEGYTDTLLEKAGLVIRGNRGYYDRFRGRIMFPLHDAGGRIIGFSGRVFGVSQNVNKENSGAKYINSPATVLYDKSRILYGYDTAKEEIRQTKTCVVVEGQMDVILSKQAGVNNTVAASGTALTEEHLRIIKRLADTVVLVFDSDDAGFSASHKSASLALSLEMNVRAAALPLGRDPADMAKQNPDEWKHIITDAAHIIDFYISAINIMELSTEEKNKKIEDIVLPAIARIPNRIHQARYVSTAAAQLGVSEETVFEEIKRRRNMENEKRGNAVGIRPSAHSHVSARDMIEKRLRSIILWKSSDKDFDVKLIRNAYATVSDRGALEELDALDDKTKNKLILMAEFSLGKNSHEVIIHEAEELLCRLEHLQLEENIKSIMEQLKNCMPEELDKEKSLMAQLADIRKKQEKLTTREPLL